jgi:hypothetical protein
MGVSVVMPVTVMMAMRVTMIMVVVVVVVVVVTMVVIGVIVSVRGAHPSAYTLFRTKAKLVHDNALNVIM